MKRISEEFMSNLFMVENQEWQVLCDKGLVLLLVVFQAFLC